MKWALRVLLQALLFVVLMMTYRTVTAYFPQSQLTNDIIYIAITVLPPIILFRDYKFFPLIVMTILCAAANILLGFYVLSAVFQDGI